MPADLPAARTRAEAFDDLVLDAVEHLERWWADPLAGVEFAVEDVPPPPDGDAGEVALGRCLAAGADRGVRVVVYRRPVLARAEDEDDLASLVHEVVVEQVAVALGRSPDEVDPRPPS